MESIREIAFARSLLYALRAILLICMAASCWSVFADDKAPPPRPKPDLAHGRTIFENTCAECHDAYSKEERIGPGLQGMSTGKLPDGNKVNAEKLLDIINRGPAEMPSFKDRLTEQEKADVVAFVMTL